MTAPATGTNEQLSPRFQSLVGAHQHVERLMSRHQEALVGFDLAEARRLFDQLRCQTIEHMQFEELELLPAYAEHGQWERGGRPELFRAEHHQIYLMINHLTRILDDLDSPDHLTRRAVIDLLDAEKAFKGVLEHHSLRENTYLYPALNRIERPGHAG